MKTILLIGKNGQVGWELQRTLAPLGNVKAFGFPEINLADPDGTRTIIHSIHPDVIINAAAYNAVDKAESDRKTAFALNTAAPRLLAEEAKILGAALIHYSTDFVFNGEKGAPYAEEDSMEPLNVYGQTKLEGENAVEMVGGGAIILRTAWVYSTRRPSFVTKVLDWARKSTELRIVTDQVGSPTWCRILAEATAQIIAMGGQDLFPWLKERRGVYHLAGSGAASRFEWAQAILRYDPKKDEHLAKSITRAQSAEFPTPARRPANSALNCEKFAETFGLRLPPWEEALKMALDTG